MSHESDPIYQEELIREKARLDERARRDRIARELSRERETASKKKKFTMNLVLVAFGAFMAFQILRMFF
jgi:hypothetical protein